MKEKLRVIRKGLLLCSLTVITIWVFQSCKDKKCPDDLPLYLKDYMSNFQGKSLTYKNQYNEILAIPPGAEPSTNIRHRKDRHDCYLRSFLNTLNNCDTCLYFGISVDGAINDQNLYDYNFYINLGKSDTCKKYFDFAYLDRDPPVGYPGTLSNDSTIYHGTYQINTVDYSKVFQVILTDSLNSKPFLKQYFFNKEKTFIRMDERYTDKIWILQ